MEKFRVKNKHLTGEIADFPRRVVQAMVDEQVRQGNPADPCVFARDIRACTPQGGFSWYASTLGFSWAEIILKKKFHLVPKKRSVEPNAIIQKQSVEPHAIIQHMLAKGMDVWACVSDKSYDDARDKIDRCAYRVTRYSTDSCYPVWTWYVGWQYAIPIDTATMTEITRVPK